MRKIPELPILKNVVYAATVSYWQFKLYEPHSTYNRTTDLFPRKIMHTKLRTWIIHWKKYFMRIPHRSLMQWCHIFEEAVSCLDPRNAFRLVCMRKEYSIPLTLQIWDVRYKTSCLTVHNLSSKNFNSIDAKLFRTRCYRLIMQVSYLSSYRANETKAIHKSNGHFHVR